MLLFLAILTTPECFVHAVPLFHIGSCAFHSWIVVHGKPPSWPPLFNSRWLRRVRSQLIFLSFEWHARADVCRAVAFSGSFFLLCLLLSRSLLLTEPRGIWIGNGSWGLDIRFRRPCAKCLRHRHLYPLVSSCARCCGCRGVIYMIACFCDPCRARASS